MGCGFTVSRNILVAAPTLTFAHDPNNVTTQVQLSTFELVPPDPCFAAGGGLIYLTGTTVDETYLFWFDEETSLLELYGDSSVIDTVVTYDVFIQTFDEIWDPFTDLLLETITVDWTAAPTCDTPAYVVDAAATVTSFAHDPMLAAGTVVQLSTFHLDP